MIFALLCNSGKVDRPYREIAELAGVAHGTVSAAITSAKNDNALQARLEKRFSRDLSFLA